jgi:hypothetical protein
VKSLSASTSLHWYDSGTGMIVTVTVKFDDAPPVRESLSASPAIGLTIGRATTSSSEC